MLVDSHCHLNLLSEQTENQSIKDFIETAKNNDVGHILNVSVDLKDFPNVLSLAQNYPHISASVGLHPNEQSEQVTLEQLLHLGQHKEIVAIGETGLDYFRSEGDLEWQINRFRVHIAAAKALRKPLIVHTRQAKNDTIQIMREENAADAAGVMHCFTEDWAMAKDALELNFYISFSGILTFKNAHQLQEVAKLVPDDRILIETDAPYLAPEPFRGHPNQPAFIKYTAAYLAELRHTTYEHIADITTQNFFKLFEGAQP